MKLGIEAVIWYLLLIDSIFANLTVIFWQEWWKKKKLDRVFPMSIWWTLLYLVLVIWAGFALYRLGILF